MSKCWLKPIGVDLKLTQKEFNQAVIAIAIRESQRDPDWRLKGPDKTPQN